MGWLNVSLQIVVGIVVGMLAAIVVGITAAGVIMRILHWIGVG